MEKPENAPEFEAQSPAKRKAVFEAQVLIHLDSAYTVARYLARRNDLAEDLVQDALLRAYRSFDASRCTNVRAWLLAIVRNCFLSWKARAGEETLLADPEGGGAGCDGEQDTPESILIRQQEDGAMRLIIEALPRAFREVLVLRDIEDMSYREIADITGVPMGTVMSRLARARKMFAAAWTGSAVKPSKEISR